MCRRRREEGEGRRKEGGGRRKEEGGRRKEEGGRRERQRREEERDKEGGRSTYTCSRYMCKCEMYESMVYLRRPPGARQQDPSGPWLLESPPQWLQKHRKSHNSHHLHAHILHVSYM